MRIGEVTHGDRSTGSLPLDGVKILSAEQMISLPYMTQLLATRRDWYTHTHDLIRPAIEAWASDKSKFEAARVLAENGIAAGPSFTPADLADDEHVRTRGMLVEVQGPEGTMRVAGNPLKFSHNGDGPVRRFPDLGADTDAVLSSQLGLSDEELTELHRKRVI